MGKQALNNSTRFENTRNIGFRADICQLWKCPKSVQEKMRPGAEQLYAVYKKFLISREFLAMLRSVKISFFFRKGRIAMRWYNTSLGKKYIMAVTGIFLILFVIAHMLGNLSVFGGAASLNAYAEHLRAFPPLLWGFRGVMALAFVIHIWMGITLYLENKSARPVAYAKKVNDRTSFSALNMIWTGLLLLAFVVYHILHFTTHTLNPEFAGMVEPSGAFNVFAMVSSAFHHFGVALVYVIAMIILLLHVSHGFQSFFQSLGWTNYRTLPGLEKASRVVAFVLMFGFIIIPIALFFGVI
jgi:succinate dehydrogenase / fumarate reductase cytochrome b subunit